MERGSVTSEQVEKRKSQFVKQISQVTQEIQGSELRLLELRQRLTATQGALAALDEILTNPVNYGEEVPIDEKAMEV